MNRTEPTTGDWKREVKNPTHADFARAYRELAERKMNANGLVCVDTAMIHQAADRLESQEREIERLKRENDALYRIGMGRDGVLIPKKEYEPIRFCKVPIADAIPMVEGFAALTARAEKAERERDAAVVDMKSIVDAVREEYSDGTCCFACKYDFDTSCDEYGCCPGECPGFESNDCFEWRGLPQEGEKQNG